MARERKTAPRKVLPPADIAEATSLLFELYDPDLSRLRTYLPTALTEPASTSLFDAIYECCKWLARERDRLERGSNNADMMRRPGKAQRAPIEELAHHLRKAADVWKEIRGDRAGDVLSAESMEEFGLVTVSEGFDRLEELAQDAERQFDSLRALEQEKAANPWPVFVRGVRRCLEDAGLEPGATGSLYDAKPAKPTWFQRFIRALNAMLPEGVREPDTMGEPAFATKVARAMRKGDR